MAYAQAKHGLSERTACKLLGVEWSSTRECLALEAYTSLGSGRVTRLLERMIAEGDRVAIRWTCTMIHNGDGLGFPATGKKTTVPGSSFVICQNGQLIDGYNFIDLSPGEPSIYRKIVKTLQTSVSYTPLSKSDL